MKKIAFVLSLLCVIQWVSAQEVQWATNPGSTGYDEVGGVTVDKDGNVITVGYFLSTIDLNPGAGTASVTSAGLYDIYIQKLDKDGNYLWGARIGGSNSDYAYGVTADTAGNIYVTGEFRGNVDFDPSAASHSMTSGTGYGQDGFILKLSPSGAYIWSDLFGGTSTDRGWEIAVDSAMNMYVTGVFGTSCQFDPFGSGATTVSAWSSSDIFVLKLNAGGDLQYVHTVAGSGGTSVEELVVRNGKAYLTGKFEGSFDHDGVPGPNVTYVPSAGLADAFLLQLNSSGATEQFAVFGSVSMQYGFGLDVTPSGEILLAGAFQDTLDFDPGPGTMEIGSGGSLDAFILSLSPSFGLNWVYTSASASNDNIRDICLSPTGEIWLTGEFTDSLDVDFGSASSMVLANNSTVYYDAFILKLDAAGGYLWSGHLATTDQMNMFELACGPGGVALCGRFNDSLDTDLGTGSTWLVTNGNYDPFTLKLDICPAFSPSISFVSPNLITNTGFAGYQWFLGAIPISGANSDTYTPSATGYYQVELTDSAGCVYLSDSLEVIITALSNDQELPVVTIFPNPAHHNATLALGQTSAGNEQIRICDLTGAIVLENNIAAGVQQVILDLTSLPAGMYLIHYLQQDQDKVIRLAIQ